MLPERGSEFSEVGNPLQCSCLENPMDREAWRATVHRVAALLFGSLEPLGVGRDGDTLATRWRVMNPL